MQSLEDRIAISLDNLSPKQKRLARFVLDNKYFMSFASANQAAGKTSTSAATVVRFAQALGYQGYSAMQSAIQDELPHSLTFAERIQARLRNLPSHEETPHSVFATDIRNIQRTAGKLVGAKLEAAVQEILNAERILVVGSGLSSGSALILAHELKVIGLDARPVLGGGLPLAVDLAQLKQGSLLIAIDLWRYVRSTLKAVETAKRAGVMVIAITDSIMSPLSEAADYAFEVATESTYHSMSLTAVVSLVNVLAATLSYRKPEEALESLQRVEAAYRENDLLLSGR
jgi:DNA-binding MurR/RpiR family transcriptional regulator